MPYRLYRNIESTQFAGQRYPPTPLAKNDPNLVSAINMTLVEKTTTFRKIVGSGIKIYALRDVTTIEQLRNLYADICDLLALQVSLSTDDKVHLLLELPKYRPAVIANRGSYNSLIAMQI